MSYFTEVSDYQSYHEKKEDFHWNFNANSGGGQQFLGGQFINEKGVLSSPTTLDGCVGIFNIMLKRDKNQDIFIPLDDQGQYKIKPRSKGSSSMKLEIGTGTSKMANPNMLISSFFMLPPTCNVKNPTNLEVSILTTSNYWLQSMWLECNTTKLSTKKVSLIPIDFIYCGGSKDKLGKDRFFKLDAQKRVDDIISLSKNSGGFPNNLTQNIKVFTDIYLGNKHFNYNHCIEATRQIMILLSENYPDSYSGIEDPLPFLMTLKNNQRDLHNEHSQIIFYGAPGTGKSHTIDKKTQGHDVIRTTFHPDSDHSTFVGCYKPNMGNPKPIYGFDSNGNTVKVEDPKNTVIEEQKIEYKYVKQAFLKAYIAAWKKVVGHVSSTRGISFSVGTATYTILSVDDKGLQQSKTDQINKIIVERVWEKLWESGSFVIPTGAISGESVQQAISKWIYDNVEDCKKESFIEGWEKLTNYLKENEIEVKKDGTDRSKKYTLSWSENKDSVRFSADSGNTKDRIQKCYEGYDEATGVEKGIIDILNNYGADNFDDAWTKLREDVGNSNLIGDIVAPQFLIIEEINRGNCAQIFGDIFQLLDRQNNGFSEYPIEADTDMQEAIAEELQYVDIRVNWAVKNYKSCVDGATLSDDIKAGRILLLPNNLFIWATMNTSDQSLFPMDSAFKRRWDWECVPIDYENEKSRNFTITVDGKRYNWHDFLKAVNKKIFDATKSEDKQMGNFFIKGDVDEKQFINKVMFYLWNDICKEEYDTNNNFFRYYTDAEKKTEKQFTFNDLFKKEAKGTLANFMVFLEVDDEETKKKKSEAEKAVVPSDPETVPVS